PTTLPLHISTFSFYSSRDPRDLHSFPTRRSSDLLVVHRYAAVQAQREIEAGARNAMLTFQVLQHQQQIALSGKADLLATLAYMRDRKSTRLNSSHLGISYAVFCLKKKKNIRKGKK